jgi:phenylalanyl-tRNA synthetase beta chain
MRGVESAGMLCSARELGLSEDHEGLLELEGGFDPGCDLRVALALNDHRFELKLTPNRPDCLGVLGIAREVAALSGAPLSLPPARALRTEIPNRLPVRILAPDLCGRFCGRVIRGVNPAALTPGWMKQRLERSGQRSISALVDISNYVMLERSRPTHVFDLDRIDGSLEVRWAREGEKLTLLNGATIDLDETCGVIADESAVESLAGIMGGAATAVSDATRNVYVEAAFWWPEAIAGRSRRFQFSTDAGHRFERGVDPASTATDLDEVCSLIVEICGGKVGPLDDQILKLPERPQVRLRLARARKVSGVALSRAEVDALLGRLQFVREWLGSPKEAGGDSGERGEGGEPGEGGKGGEVVVVTPPSFRFDVQIEEDLIEEVVRLRGYDRLPQRAPRAVTVMRDAPETERSLIDLKRSIAARGYQEVIHFSFASATLDRKLTGLQGISLINPMASTHDVMRTAISTGLLEALRYNLHRKAERVRLFEHGRVFLRAPGAPPGPLDVQGIRQPLRMALLAYGPHVRAQWGEATREIDFFDVKGDLEALLVRRTVDFVKNGIPISADSPMQPPTGLHPTRQALILEKERMVGWIGVLHPRLQQELELPEPPVLAEVEAWLLQQGTMPKPENPSRFPPVIRDLAFVIDRTQAAGPLSAAIKAAGGGRIQEVAIFDEYQGKTLKENEKSIAFRLLMQHTQRTLDEGEVQLVMQDVMRALEVYGARLRS